MNNKKLNNLVIEYQKAGEENIFEAIHEMVTEEWGKTNAFIGLGRKHRIDKEDAESIAKETLFDALDKKVYKDGRSDFFNLLRKMVSNACIDEKRRLNIFRRAGSLDETIAGEDGDDSLSVIDSLGYEEEGYEEMERKSDQRQLIAELLGKASEKCRQALAAYSESDNFLDAGKRLGVRNVTAESRINKIAEHFDYDKWGDINDYLYNDETQCDSIVYPYHRQEQPNIEDNAPVYPVYTYYI